LNSKFVGNYFNLEDSILTNGILKNNPKDASFPFMKKISSRKIFLKNFGMSKNNIIFH
jgi:hypothetical protein